MLEQIPNKIIKNSGHFCHRCNITVPAIEWKLEISSSMWKWRHTVCGQLDRVPGKV